MRIYLIVVGALLLAGSAARAASPQEAVLTYSIHRADINSLTPAPGPVWQNGAGLGYAYSLSPSFALAVDASAHFYRHSSGSTLNLKRDQYYLLGGFQYRPVPGRRISPFVHILAGTALFRGYTEIARPSREFFFDDAMSFAAGLGGGIDVRVAGPISVRMLAFDVLPTHFGPQTQWNVRLSFGVVYQP